MDVRELGGLNMLVECLLLLKEPERALMHLTKAIESLPKGEKPPVRTTVGWQAVRACVRACVRAGGRARETFAGAEGVCAGARFWEGFPGEKVVLLFRSQSAGHVLSGAAGWRGGWLLIRDIRWIFRSRLVCA